MTPIDRAAEAIARADPEYEAPSSWTKLARAALAAIREPTPEMIEAGAKALREAWFGGASGGSYEEKWRWCAAVMFRAMHDAMMREK